MCFWRGLSFREPILMLRRLIRRQPRRQANAHALHRQSCTSLCCARSGARVCVLEITGCETEACKLRDLGLREGALVTVVRHGDPILVRVDESRVGIGEVAAQNVLCEYVQS